jgi:hypothetical protein
MHGGGGHFMEGRQVFGGLELGTPDDAVTGDGQAHGPEVALADSFLQSDIENNII